MPRRLLLLGGGAVHLGVLQALAREPLAATEVALVSAHDQTVMPLLWPAQVAGRRPLQAVQVALQPWAAAAGVTWVPGRVVGLDAAARTAVLADGRVIDYELLSVDEPWVEDRRSLPGAAEHALALHPLPPSLALLEGLWTLARQRPVDIVVIGASTAALELVLALAERLSSPADEQARVAWLAGAAGLAGVLVAWPEAARLAAQNALRRRRVTVFADEAAALQAGSVQLRSGARLACDAALLAQPPGPPPWLAASGLVPGEAQAPRGWPTGQSASHPEVFVAPADARPSWAAAWAANLRRAASGAPLQPLPPRPALPRTLALDGGHRLWARGRLAWQGRGLALWLERGLRAQAALPLPALTPPAGS